MPTHGGNGFAPPTVAPGQTAGEAWRWDDRAGGQEQEVDAGAAFAATPLSPELARWLESVRTGEVEPLRPRGERQAANESLVVETRPTAGGAPTPFGAESVPPVVTTGQSAAEQPTTVAAVASPEAPEPVAEEPEEPPAAEPAPAEDVVEEAEAVDEDVAETAAELAPTEAEEPASTADATAAELSAWRAQMRASTSAIQAPGLGDAAGGAGVLRAAGAARRAGRQAATGDLTQDAQAAVSTPPDPGKPLQPPPEEHPVPEAPKLVEAKSNRLLPKQRLPELIASPRGSIPVMGERPTPPPEPEPPVMEMQRVGPGADPAPEADPNEAHAAEVEEAAEQPATPEAAAEPADPLLIKDEPPQPPPPLPPAAKVAVSVVVARMMAEPQSKAERILNDARTPAYSGVLVQEYPDIGNDELPGLTEAVTTELRMVAHAAGIGDEELNARVAERQAELEAQRAAEEAAVCEANEEETQSRQETGQAEADATAAARTSVDLNTERQTEAAAGPNDPTVVRARRDRLKDAISRSVGQQRQLYDAAVARRHRQLQLGERAQVLAYQAVVQREETAITALEPGQSTVTLAQGLDAARVRLWGQERERELHREILRLTREATASGDQYKTEIWTAGDEAREMIHSWANGLLKEQESWWETLLRMFQDWMVQAKAESEAWEQVRAAETKDALLMDLVFLNQETQRLGENVDRATIEARTDIGEEQKAVLLAYYSDGPEARNPIAAVAAGVLVRMSLNRRPELMRRFERIVLDKPYTDWEKQEALAITQNPSFSAAKLADDLYAAMKGGVFGAGTDEAAVFAALDRLTPLQATTVRNAYRAEYDRDLDEDLKDELSGAEEDRAIAQLEGNQALAVAAELYEAMKGGLTGAGTDEDVIMAALRNKTQEERDAIEAEYLRAYGTPLRDHLKDEMSGHDIDRAEALVEGDTAKADAIAVDQAMRGGFLGLGTDEKAIEGVYNTVRQDVIAYGARQDPPWTTAQVDAEVRRRNMQVESSYNTLYGDDWGAGEESALRKAFESELSGPELDLATALADYDLAKADAARIAIESQSILYADDDVINGVLESQYTRALEDVRRDGALRMRDLEERAQKEGWDAYRLEAEKRALEREFETLAKKRAADNMDKLEARYDSAYPTWYGGGLRATIELNMSGHDREKARDLLANDGYLSPAKQIHYAVAGAGTREEALKEALKGRTAAEIAEIRAEWETLHPGENMDERIDSELSGRDDFDTKMLLEGVPENAEQELAQMRERAQYELNNSAASGSKVQRDILKRRLERLEEQYEVITKAPEGPQRTAAIAKFKQRSAGVSSAVESYRKQVDAVTDVVATVAAITAAVVVTVLVSIVTAGAGGAAIVAALAASLGTSTAGLTAGVAAAAALAATVITKQAMLGGAYGWEDVGVDLAVGAVDIVAAVGTAGIGNALIRAGRAGRLATMAASKSRGARILAHGLAEGAEGLMGSFPAAIAGNVLNDKNLEQGNPFANIALGTLIETGMGTAMSGGMGALGGIKAPRGGPPVRAPSADLLAHRGTPEGRLAQWRAYKLENPDANMQEFLRQFDAGAAQRLAGEEAAQQLQRKLRGDLLSGLPANQRGVLGGVPIEVLSEADFARLARGVTGPTALINVDGVARLLVKEGTDPRALAAQADSLARSVVRDARGRPVRVDDVLPRDLRGRVPVAVDPNLTGNTVRVLYDIDPKTGLVTNIRMLTGPTATSVDIQLHARTARLMERYAGFLGRARQILDRIGTWVGLNGAPPPGSRAWEARLEVEKLPRIIRDRLEQLKNADLTPAMRRELLEDVANLQRQLDYHEAALRDMELEPGRGFVAAEADPKLVTPTSEAPKAPTKVRDATLPDDFQKTVIQDAIKKIDKIDPPLITPAQFEIILKNVPGGVKGAEEFASRLNIMLASMEKLTARATEDAEKTAIVSAVRKILQGLADTDAKVRDTAEFLRAQAVKSPTKTDATLARMSPEDVQAAKASDSLAAASRILKTLSLDDIRAIRADHPNMGATGREHDNAVFDALAAVTGAVKDADATRLRALIAEAGVTTVGGAQKPDIFRLWSILEIMGGGPHTADAVSAGIVAQNDLLDRMKNLKGGLVAELEKRLGLVRTAQGGLPDNLLSLRKLREAQVGGAITGEDIQDFFRDDWVIPALESMVDATGKIDMANWRQLEDWLRRAALDAKKVTGEPDLQIINQMRNIIGYYWEVVRFKSLEVTSGTKKVYAQAEMKIDGTPYEPRIDNMVIEDIDPKNKTVTIWLEEDKTGDATLSRAQEELFDRFHGHGNLPPPKVTVKFDPEILSKAGVQKSEELTVIIKDVVVWYPENEINRQAGATATSTTGQQ